MMAGICKTCRGSETQHKLGGAEGCECYPCLYERPDRCSAFDPAPPAAKPARINRSRGQREALNGRSDSTTQLEGGDVTLPKAGTRRAEAYNVIRAAGRAGRTFDELCGDLGRDYSRTGPRVRELVADGLVRKAGFRREASSGAMQDVWTATCYDETLDPESTV
jgi:hypothetical protein